MLRARTAVPKGTHKTESTNKGQQGTPTSQNFPIDTNYTTPDCHCFTLAALPDAERKVFDLPSRTLIGNFIGVTAMNTLFRSTSTDANILSLSLGQLCPEERAKLVALILNNPETAALAKLGMRVASPAQQTASAMVSAAGACSRHNKWNARNWVTGACASLALLAVFSFSDRSMQVVEPGRIAMNQVAMNQMPVSDQFGPAGSFEGAAVQRLELADRFGGGGFEAD